MVESFELNVPFVGTADNVADFFTKALDAKTFFRFRNILIDECAVGASVTAPVLTRRMSSHASSLTSSHGGASESDGVRHH